MRPVRIGDLSINLEQVTWVDFDYRLAGEPNKVHVIFGPGMQLDLTGDRAQRFRDSAEVASMFPIRIGTRAVNLDQIAYVDFKYPVKLAPEGVKDVIHIRFTPGNQLSLFDDNAKEFRKLYKEQL